MFRLRDSNPMIRNSLLTFFLLAALTVVGLVSPAAADSCGPVYDAIPKTVTTPRIAAFLSCQTRRVETIYFQGKTYMIVKGKWWLSPLTPNDVLEQEKENEPNSKATCQFVCNQSINGEAAAVYSMSRETENAKENNQLWISKSTGLTLRKES
jgi:hypothetical protein